MGFSRIVFLNDLDEEENIIFQRSSMMTSPGCSDEDISELTEKLPGIPNSYTSIIQKYNFNGIDIGYFGICPSSFNEDGMIANLLEGNEEGVLFIEYAKPFHLYSIATFPDFGIFVATAKSPYQEGEIIAIDENIYAEEKENQKKWFFRIAKDFEQFLLIAGNVNQIRREINQDYSNEEEKRQEFFERLKDLKVANEYHEAWQFLF